MIGIHKEGGKKENYGNLISPILNIFQNKKEKIYYKIGNYYIVEWKNGLKHGKGILFYENGNIVYKGAFIEDKFEGFGEYFYDRSDYYVSKFLESIMNGKGKLYDGDFIYYESKGNKLDIYKYGNYYIGEWKKGKKYGEGKIYSKNKEILYDGYFIDDKFMGKKTYLFMKLENII